MIVKPSIWDIQTCFHNPNTQLPFFIQNPTILLKIGLWIFLKCKCSINKFFCSAECATLLWMRFNEIFKSKISATNGHLGNKFRYNCVLSVREGWENVHPGRLRCWKVHTEECYGRWSGYSTQKFDCWISFCKL